MKLDLLELSQAATERDLKRAYARLLKVHRPDTDPEAFQRLRQAYERALADLSRPVSLDEEPRATQWVYSPSSAGATPIEPVPTMDGKPLGAPVQPVQREAERPPTEPSIQRLSEQLLPDDTSRLAKLLEGDLTLAWEIARREGLEAAFQRQLLQRCLNSADLRALAWAQANLHWLTLAQPDYLGPREEAVLANQLAAQVLVQMRQALAQGLETQAYKQLRAALESDWLQPLDRRTRFQAEVFELLENDGHWTPAFFDRVCALNAWSEERGHLPCSTKRWTAIVGRCHAYALEASLRDQLATPAKTVGQRAAWFLLGELDDRRRRQWADSFTAEDWQACIALEEDIATFSQIPAALQRPYFAEWRSWMPRGYWRWGYVYLWAMLSLALTIMLVANPEKSIGESLGILLVAPLAVVPLAFVLPATWLMRLWTDLSRLIAPADVALSARMLPRRLTRRGSGVLVLRHMFPSLLPAGLVWMWGRAVPMLGPVMALATVLGAMQFANVVTRGASPVAWLERGLHQLLQNRRRAKQVLALGAGLALMVAARLFIG